MSIALGLKKFLYDRVATQGTKATREGKDAMGYIVGNFSKKQFIRPGAFGEQDSLRDILDSYQGVLCGLVVLLSDGNNRGGGDLRSDHQVIGSWAGDRVMLVDESALVPEFSEPGMEDVPLQKQLLSTGQDVSQDVIEAIVDGEGDYSRLTQLNPRHVLPLEMQGQLHDSGRAVLLTAEGRASKLMYQEQVFELLGQKMVFAPQRSNLVLEAGVNNTAILFGRPERYLVSDFATERGRKTAGSVSMFARRGETESVEGVISVKFSLMDMDGNRRQVSVSLDAINGTSVAEYFAQLYPGLEFERPATPGIQSPEVAKLLSFLKEPPKGAL